MKTNVVLIVVTVCLFISLIVVAILAQIWMIDRVIMTDSERTAVKWARYLSSDVPAIEQALKSGMASPEQQSRLSAAIEVGDVFRFKLFDTNGRLSLVSDSLGLAPRPEAERDHDEHADEVLRTGRNVVFLAEGNKDNNRPAHYAEAYVPVVGADHSVVGVAEVYIDKSEMAAVFYSESSKVSIGRTIVFTVVIFALYLAYQFRRRQEYKARNQMNYLARFDQLSKLRNRTGFEEHLTDMKRRGRIDPAKTAMIYLDIDHFKDFNDSLGHKAGDAYLRKCGEAIIACLGPSDTACRFGGDEFVVVVQRPDIESVMVLCEQLQALASVPLNVDGVMVSAHVSMGVCYGSSADHAFDECIHRADLALYQAKMDGRNTSRIFSPELEKKVERRRKLEVAVLTGLSKNLFSVFFQPLLHQATNKCVGFEALLRLTDVDGESIPPVEFIPIAESMGAIGQLGEWVLARAAESAVLWPDPLFVSVNLSVRQFDDETLVGTVKKVIEATGLDPKRLELEVTESLLMENTASVGAQLAELRAFGVAIAMDDFGTGYSSLGYLWQFGFDKLKIDRSFIRGLEQDQVKAREILDTIILLGHRLDMTVTAEGIETLHQAEILSELSCDQVQGYLYGRPMPETELAAYLMSAHQREGSTPSAERRAVASHV